MSPLLQSLSTLEEFTAAEAALVVQKECLCLSIDKDKILLFLPTRIAEVAQKDEPLRSLVQLLSINFSPIHPQWASRF